MVTDKEIKKEFKKKATKEYETTYPVKTLKELGFKRYKCNKCKRYFWNIKKTDICGDTECVGKLTFIGNSPCKKKISYILYLQESQQ